MKERFLFCWILVVLFLAAHFVSEIDDEFTDLTVAIAYIPDGFFAVCKNIRWILLVVISAITLFLFRYQKINVYKPVLFFSLFYFVQLLYALADGYDVYRFFGLTVLSFLVPHFIIYTISISSKLILYLFYAVLFLFVLSVLMNYTILFSGGRFFGIFNNPNLYGISALFWISIVLAMPLEFLLRFRTYILIFIVVTVFLSGSRAALAGLAIILSFVYSSKIGKGIVTLSILTALIMALSTFYDFSYLTSRFEDIGQSSKSSGREDIWEKAMLPIKFNFWWGNGMDANYRIANTGNMHNSYIRLLLNMGFVYSLAALTFILKMYVRLFRNFGKFPKSLLGFILAYGFMNIGEDYFIGIGSSVFIYLLFILGLIGSYHSSKNSHSII